MSDRDPDPDYARQVLDELDEHRKRRPPGQTTRDVTGDAAQFVEDVETGGLL